MSTDSQHRDAAAATPSGAPVEAAEAAEAKPAGAEPAGAEPVGAEPAEEEAGDLLDRLTEVIAADANWRVRKKSFLDVLDVIELHFDQDREQRGEDGAPPPEVPTDGEDPEDFVEVVPMLIAGILKRLGNAEIRCAEQAAFHLLSAAPDHHIAARAWANADFKNDRALRKLLRADRRLADWFEQIDFSLDDSVALPE
ncbi:MAG: hypothetical protein GC191_03390 [Azospirillum sp.]|nr:hypothetical protein [Azospirillum sp.]